MVKIISDSTCDLSEDLIKKYDISILPLHIHLGDEEYEDGVNISPEEIFRWSDTNKTTPKTSALSISDVVDLFNQYENKDIICFSISEDMSATANVMRLAAQEVDREEHIYVINSKNLSTGNGLLVIEAAIMAEKGKSAPEIVVEIEKMIPRVRASFVVDTLTYLHRGGRCGSVAALAGGALHLHPKIVVQDGKMHADKKYRGKMKSTILSYVKDMESDLKAAKKDRVFITHSGCDNEVVKLVREYLEELQIFDEILETQAGGVISSHCGPGTLGVLYIS